MTRSRPRSSNDNMEPPKFFGSQRDPSPTREVLPTPETADYFSRQKDNMELP